MWLWNDKIFTDDMIKDYVGFVYMITNLDNGKKYVGKKSFSMAKTYQKNKKKRRTRVQSNWQSYTGSNKELNEDITTTEANLRKEILHLCGSKGWMSYYEPLEILNRRAIQSDAYYNGWVSAKIQRSHIITTENNNESARTTGLD